ncbi:hypothetical protein BGX21_002174 [Mortierella sp. AD011]|nr:hypothetical protein BGX21_002174 [Mortierella sp. AD011]
MLQLEQLRQEQEQENRLDGSYASARSILPPRHNYTGSSTAVDELDNGNYITVPIKSLQEFLQTGERMFVDLEESIYSQLYQHLKSESGSASSSTPASGPSSPRLYISLALLFGTTITTPKEQYMIRIGPLEPQQGLLIEVGSRNFSLGEIDSASNAPPPLPSLPTPLSAAPWHSNETYSNVNAEQKREQDQKRSREEKTWERKLVQQIMGITSIMDTETDQEQQQQDSYEQPSVSSFQSSNSSLSNRTRVHLLTKAPAGLIFQGLLPKQMITIQEDYSLRDIETANLYNAETDTDSNISLSAGRRKRWPVHHIHVFGPASSHTLSSSSLSLSSSLPSSTSDAQDEIWYQVGPGIPILSPLL